MTLHAARRDSASASSPSKKGPTTSVAAAVMPPDLLRDGKIFRQLAEIAFIGAYLGQVQAAETIFRGLRVLCPGNPNVEMGLAMVYSLAGRPMDGLAILDRAAGLDPGEGLVPVCAGLMLREAGHHAAADKKLAEASARGGVAADFAQALSRSKLD